MAKSWDVLFGERATGAADISPEKVRALYERPGSPGEKAAAKAALQRMGAWSSGKPEGGHKWRMEVSGVHPSKKTRQKTVVSFIHPGTAHAASEKAFEIVGQRHGWTDMAYHRNTRNGDNPKVERQWKAEGLHETT